MPAKIGSRDRGSKVDFDAEKFVVVQKDTGRRCYVGSGVPEEDAERIAKGMVVEAISVPFDEVVGGYWVKPVEESDTETEADA